MYRSVRKNLYVIPGSPATLIIKCGDSSWLVDPGVGDGRPNIIIEVLNRLNIHEYNVLISHTHYDHVEVLPHIKSRWVYVNESEYSQLISPTVREHATYGFNPLPHLMKLQRLTVPSRFVSTFSLNVRCSLDCLELLDLSGHSPGLTGVVLDDVVFVGDSLFGDMLLRRVGIPYHSDVFKSLKVLNEVLRSLSDEGFEAVLSHGPVLKGLRFKELIDLNVDRINRIVDLVGDELRSGKGIEELTVRVLKVLGVELNVSNIYLGSVTVSSIISKFCDDGIVEHVVSDEGVKWRLVRR